MSNKRKTGLDYLRLFATFQVILFHIYQNYGYGQPSTSFLFIFFSVLSKTNNFHFMLISSYIGCKSSYLISKTFPLIMSTIFYSVFDYFNGIFFFKRKEFHKEDLFIICFPIAYGSFWYIYPFLSSQFLLSFIYPSLDKLSKRYFFIVCIIFLLIYSLPEIGLYRSSGLGEQLSVGPFTLLSFIASYIRFHYKSIALYKLIILYFILFVYNVIVHQKPEYFDSEWRLIKLLGKTWITHFPSVIFSIPLFLISLKLTKYWRFHFFIQTFAECSMGIYMFHCSYFHINSYIEFIINIMEAMAFGWSVDNKSFLSFHNPRNGFQGQYKYWLGLR